MLVLHVLYLQQHQHYQIQQKLINIEVVGEEKIVEFYGVKMMMLWIFNGIPDCASKYLLDPHYIVGAANRLNLALVGVNGEVVQLISIKR